MWTEAHRARHDARLKEIVSLHAVAQVARWLERVDPPRSGRATPYGAVVRAIAWPLRVGGSGAPCGHITALAHRVDGLFTKRQILPDAAGHVGAVEGAPQAQEREVRDGLTGRAQAA